MRPASCFSFITAFVIIYQIASFSVQLCYILTEGAML